MAIGQIDTERVELEPRISAQIKGARETAAAPLEIRKDSIPPLGAQRIQALLEEPLVINAGPLLVAVTRAAGERWFADPGRLR
jgi:hypothetical protein